MVDSDESVEEMVDLQLDRGLVTMVDSQNDDLLSQKSIEVVVAKGPEDSAGYPGVAIRSNNNKTKKVEDSCLIIYGDANLYSNLDASGYPREEKLAKFDSSDDDSINKENTKPKAILIPPTMSSKTNRKKSSAPKKDLSAATAWPHTKTLILNYPEITKKLLHACAEARAPQTLKASDTGNVKGNGWARALDNLFCDDRGILAKQLPPIVKATQFKKKMLDIQVGSKA
jgi:hypothetical protein